MADNPVDYHSKNAENFVKDYPLEDKADEFFELLNFFVELVDGDKVMDAGCGTGEEVGYFEDQGLDAVGVDAAEGMIETAKERNKGDFRKMDLRKLDFDDNTFDGIWCNTTMQFFPPEEVKKVLDEFDRVLKPGGILYTTFKMGEGSKVTQDYGMKVERYLVPENQAKEMLKSRGYEVIDTGRKELDWGLEVLNIFSKNH